MKEEGFETKSARMERLLEVSVFAPQEDVDRIMAAVCRITPLSQGENYDSNAHQTAPGTERYRPLDGAVAGAETEVRKRPGVVEVSFELPDDQALLEEVVEAVFQVHSYQEPVIKVRPVLACRSKGLDDSDNPHRWWNTTGDWKKPAAGG
ncbi:MAG: hypothetical protein QNJ30_15775 [Kiloniellales bacterium]|nr:hypothetical protein [Kiloniellales bacterium]